MDENSKKKGFNKGTLMAILGWLFTLITTPLIANFVQMGRFDFSVLLEFMPIAPFYGGTLLIIWGPAAWFITRAYREKGFNKALILTVAVCAISMFIFFGCASLFV